MVSATLWDVRTQCERQMRAISDAQQLMDYYRENPATQLDVKRRLLAHLDVLFQTQAVIGQALDECERVIVQLPAVGPGPGEPDGDGLTTGGAPPHPRRSPSAR
jgi:hypothetical protein